MAAEHPIGLMIKRARERKRMSQADLAKALGVSRGAVNSWENDRSRPLSSIGALEEILNVDLTSPEAGRRPPVVLPPALQRQIDQLTPEEQEYVIARITRRREDDARQAPG